MTSSHIRRTSYEYNACITKVDAVQDRLPEEHCIGIPGRLQIIVMKIIHIVTPILILTGRYQL